MTESSQKQGGFVEPPEGTNRWVAVDGLDVEDKFGLSTLYVGLVDSSSKVRSSARYEPGHLRVVIVNPEPIAEQLNKIGELAKSVMVNDAKRQFVDKNLPLAINFHNDISLLIRSLNVAAEETDELSDIGRQIVSQLGTQIDLLELSRPKLYTEQVSLMRELHELGVVSIEPLGRHSGWRPLSFLN